MSLTSAARRLLRTLSLSQPTVMTDLQRDGRGGPAAAGTDSSSTNSCFELELWPSHSANSRRLSFHCSSSISISSAADRRDNDLRNGQSHSEFGGETSKPRNTASLRIDTPSSYEHILENPKTIPGTPNRRSPSTTNVAPILVWSEKAATRHQRTRSNVEKTSARKKGSGDEADELFWRGYWD
ncbi:hypothetical protein F4679DRAFT_317529 [Xylaria curta]|nr:hypothetical protein F4679DRAFT_317529 [Xylaria curta]